MKIFIDGSFYKGTGIGRYYSNLLKLIAEKTDWEVYTTVPIMFKEDWLLEFGKYSNVRPILIKQGKFNLMDLYHTGKIVKELERNGCKVFWFPHVNLPFYVPKNTIVTVHDLCPLTIWWDRNIIKKYSFLLFLKKTIKKSRFIVVPSKATRNELLKKFPEAKEKVKVIYNFLSPEFVHKCSQKTEPIIKEDYILFVGNRKKHKNLRNLVLAYSLIKDEINCKLVIAGSKDKGKKVDEIDKLIEEKGLSDHVIQIVSPSDEMIINLYQHAKLFVFPSFYEGFGYPPLEALACGCPVITSNIPVLREILGDEIAVFDPWSVDEIALSIKEILLQGKSKNFQKTLFKSFSPYRLGELYLNLIRQLEDSNAWKE